MKPMLQVLLLLLLAFASRGASLEGEILFSPGKGGGRGTVIRKQFGDEVKATTDWWFSTLLGRETLFVGLKVVNTGSKPIWCSYYVAFYDREKNLVCAGGSQLYDEEGLLPGKPAKPMPCILYLPKDKYKEIFSFQAVLYESDTPVTRIRKQAPLLEDPETKPSLPRNNTPRGDTAP